MARTYLGVWSTYWYITNTANPNSDEDFRGRWKFYYEQNQAALTSTITVEHYIHIYSSEYIQNGYIPPSTSKATVNNSSSTKSNNALNVSIAKGYSERLIGTSTFTIHHNSEGKANLAFSGQWTMSGVTRTASHTWSLPDIPLASSISADVSEQTLGNNIIFTIVPKENTYVHVLKYKYGTSSETQIVSGLTPAQGQDTITYTWTPPVSMAQYVTNNTYGTATIYCYAYDGTIADANYKGVSSMTIKLNIPDSVVPSGTLTITDINTTTTNETGKVPAAWGILVKGYSKLQLSASLTMAQSATLTSVLMTACDGQIGTTNPFASPQNVGASGSNLSNTCLVTDSRGRSTTITGTTNIYDYQNPSASLTVSRCDNNGTYNANGTYAKITINYQISDLNSNNIKHYLLKYREKGTQNYTTLYDTNLSNYSGTLSLTITGTTFNIGNNYEFVVVINDQFNSTEANAIMSYSQKPISVKKTTGVTIGRHATADGFNVYYDTNLYGKFNYGIVAFNDANGDNGDLTLDYDASNYSFAEIFFMTNDGDSPVSSVKVENPDGKTVMLIGMQPLGANSAAYLKSKKVLISGTSLTNVNYSEVTLKSSTNPTVNNINQIYITKIIFY